MQKLTEILNKSHLSVISDYEMSHLLTGSPARRYALVKRALGAGELLPLRRGLYAMAPAISRQRMDVFELAQRIYGPSYISLESALSIHGLIPEAVHGVTSVTSKRSVEFNTPVGMFSYARVPSSSLFADVERKASPQGVSFLAQPLKALADYVYVHKKNWFSLKEGVEDLRLDVEALSTWRASDVDALLPLYGSHRVRTFLNAVRKELPA